MTEDLVIERRVVLDANYVRGAPVALLQELRDRGFRLSVSMGPLLEVLARATRESELERFKNRFAAIAPLMDFMEPVSPTGLSLIGMLGGYVIEGFALAPHVDAVHQLRRTWHEFATALDNASWQALGDYGNESIDGFAGDMFNGSVDELRPLVDGLQGSSERERVDHLVAIVLGNVESQLWVPEGFGRRFDLFMRAWALLTVRQNRSGPGNANDAEDLAVLLNVGLPSFVVTHDKRLIARADATGSGQALWVRTASELLLDFDSLPVGPPWGTTVDEQLVRCSRTMPLVEIMKRENDLSAKLKTRTSTG